MECHICSSVQTRFACRDCVAERVRSHCSDLLLLNDSAAKLSLLVTNSITSTTSIPHNESKTTTHDIGTLIDTIAAADAKANDAATPLFHVSAARRKESALQATNEVNARIIETKAANDQSIRSLAALRAQYNTKSALLLDAQQRTNSIRNTLAHTLKNKTIAATTNLTTNDNQNQRQQKQPLVKTSNKTSEETATNAGRRDSAFELLLASRRLLVLESAKIFGVYPPQKQITSLQLTISKSNGNDIDQKSTYESHISQTSPTRGLSSSARRHRRRAERELQYQKLCADPRVGKIFEIPLPVFGEISLYPGRDALNAGVLYVVQLLHMIASYLAVPLPFQPMSNEKIGPAAGFAFYERVPKHQRSKRNDKKSRPTMDDNSKKASVSNSSIGNNKHKATAAAINVASSLEFNNEPNKKTKSKKNTNKRDNIASVGVLSRSSSANSNTSSHSRGTSVSSLESPDIVDTNVQLDSTGNVSVTKSKNQESTTIYLPNLVETRNSHKKKQKSKTTISSMMTGVLSGGESADEWASIGSPGDVEFDGMIVTPSIDKDDKIEKSPSSQQEQQSTGMLQAMTMASAAKQSAMGLALRSRQAFLDTAAYVTAIPTSHTVDDQATSSSQTTSAIVTGVSSNSQTQNGKQKSKDTDKSNKHGEMENSVTSNNGKQKQTQSQRQQQQQQSSLQHENQQSQNGGGVSEDKRLSIGSVDEFVKDSLRYGTSQLRKVVSGQVPKFAATATLGFVKQAFSQGINAVGGRLQQRGLGVGQNGSGSMDAGVLQAGAAFNDSSGSLRELIDGLDSIASAGDGFEGSLRFTAPDKVIEFELGLAMLAYNTAYLCFTQGIQIPLHATVDILGMISVLCTVLDKLNTEKLVAVSIALRNTAGSSNDNKVQDGHDSILAVLNALREETSKAIASTMLSSVTSNLNNKEQNIEPTGIARLVRSIEEDPELLSFSETKGNRRESRPPTGVNKPSSSSGGNAESSKSNMISGDTNNLPTDIRSWNANFQLSFSKVLKLALFSRRLQAQDYTTAVDIATRGFETSGAVDEDSSTQSKHSMTPPPQSSISTTTPTTLGYSKVKKDKRQRDKREEKLGFIARCVVRVLEDGEYVTDDGEDDYLDDMVLEVDEDEVHDIIDSTKSSPNSNTLDPNLSRSNKHHRHHRKIHRLGENVEDGDDDSYDDDYFDDDEEDARWVSDLDEDVPSSALSDNVVNGLSGKQ